MIEYENVIWDYIRLLLNVKWFQITLKFTWWRNSLAMTNLVFMPKKRISCLSSCRWLRSSCYDIKNIISIYIMKIFQSIIHKIHKKLCHQSSPTTIFINHTHTFTWYLLLDMHSKWIYVSHLTKNYKHQWIEI